MTILAQKKKDGELLSGNGENKPGDTLDYLKRNFNVNVFNKSLKAK